MYALNENGTLRLMESLPFRLTLPDGFTRTSLDELTNAQLTELGIYPATEVRPEFDPAKQVLGEPVLKLSRGKVTATYPVVDKSKEQVLTEVEAAKAAKLAELADARWEQETGGLTPQNGMTVKTDRESQALLTGAALYALQNASSTVEWKGANGWVTLSADDVQAIAAAVRDHVQAAFSQEKKLAEKVAACSTVAEVEAITW